MAIVGKVVESLTGSKPSASTVSRVFHTLESEYEQWKTRKLVVRYVYAFADGTYFTVIYNGEGCKMPILAVVGITETGERDVLAHIPQFAVVFFAISLVELLDSSPVWNGYPPLLKKTVEHGF